MSLLSLEVYFDVHYNYTTSRHHFWYKSGFVLLWNYFEKKKNVRKKKQQQTTNTLGKYLCLRVDRNLRAHSTCTAKRLHCRRPVADRGSDRWSRVQVVSRHTCSISSLEVPLYRHGHRCRITSPSRSGGRETSLSPLSVKTENVASLTLPCYVTGALQGALRGSYQKNEDIFKY